MHANNGRRYAIEILRPDGSRVGDEPAAPDFEPAREAVRFAHFRSDLPDPGAAIDIQPRWIQPGDPRIDGCDAHSADRTVKVDRAFFLPAARYAAARLVEQGRLAAGDHYSFNILCFRAAEPDASRAAKPPHPFDDIQIQQAPGYPCDCRRTPHPALLAGASPFGDQNPGDFPVIVPQRVLDETARLTEEAAAIETGGLLVGYLWRDTSGGELAVEVTAQVPARMARGEQQSLTFTPEAWDALDAALDLRKRGEARIGWWHSHPGSKYWCRPECAPDARARCIYSRNFFSTADASVHRTAFPAAFNIALVSTNTDAGIKFALFGWRDAVIRQRGFLVKGRTRALAEASVEPTDPGETHAKTCK